jgi:hypothetical protein
MMTEPATKNAHAHPACPAPERIVGKIDRIIDGKYAFVIDGEGYEHFLVRRQLSRWPGAWEVGTVLKFTPGVRLKPTEAARCSDVVVIEPVEGSHG